MTLQFSKVAKKPARPAKVAELPKPGKTSAMASAVRNAKRFDPTAATYKLLNDAYDYFNKALWNGDLPKVLISLQRHKGAYGYFCGATFGSRDGSLKVDEIAMNPQHFGGSRTLREILSTLVHEMAHVWEFHGGTASKTAYHNKIWAAHMKTLGLHPSSTGAPGGKETGAKVSHYIIAGGPFDVHCAAFLEKIGEADLLSDRFRTEEQEKRAKAKSASKTKFSCPSCDMNAWAKPTANIECGDCGETLVCSN